MTTPFRQNQVTQEETNRAHVAIPRGDSLCANRERHCRFVLWKQENQLQQGNININRLANRKD